MSEQQNETILQEAQRITDGDRAKAYGKALPDAQRWATIFGALTGFDVLPEHFPLALLATKLSRLSQSPRCYHRDSVVDIAGYARVVEKIHDDLNEQADIKYAQKQIREAGVRACSNVECEDGIDMHVNAPCTTCNGRAAA